MILRRARAPHVAGLTLSATLGLLGCGREQTTEPEQKSAPVASAAPSTAAAQPTPPSPPAAPSAQGGETWNGAQVAWQSWDDGLRIAQSAKKPICLVFFTTWCPHCKNFSRVFFDPRVVDRAKDFVMVRVDADASPALAQKYAPDGGYIPRTYFLTPDGTLDASIHAPRPRFQFFYDEQDPGSLLSGMDTALHKLRG